MSEILSIKQKIINYLQQAAIQAQALDKLPKVPLPGIAIERPQNPEHGDYATSFPLKLARAAGIEPLAIADIITKLIPHNPDIAEIKVAAPGFINFTFSNNWLMDQINNILSAGQTYGNIEIGEGKRIQIEFVSVNPTGPLHVGHGRGAILGSTLANILNIAGFSVEKEYYINDTGNQIDTFKRSLFTRYQQSLNIDIEMPTEGYFGNYMIELAKEIKDENGDSFLKLPKLEAESKVGAIGLVKMINRIKEDLKLLKVDFDVWFSEKSLYDNGQYRKVISMLEKRGHLVEKESATWFVSTALGEDKDNVVIRSDGSATYFATDIAYHYTKFIDRRFERVIDIWGADHQGHVSRMKAVVSALGIDPARLEVIISQMVTLRRGGELIRISKRSGDIITLREVIEEVGSDACRFFFLARSADSQMDFDLELAKKESQDNPVYYVQYAHARIASILRLAKQRKIVYNDGDVSLLVDKAEFSLIRKMLMLPEIVELVASNLEPHHLTYYAQDLATTFHSFYKQCRVVSDDEPLCKARLKLVAAAKLVLARTLRLMGMTTPDKM
ncbi:MAG: arginine--tRNA ligase [Dehalococcoidia bacterium]|nr:MAG: arginine--tRNA ligase [Dehalococcoidia bacterium]